MKALDTFESPFRFKVGDIIQHKIIAQAHAAAASAPDEKRRSLRDFIGDRVGYIVVSRLIEECCGGCQPMYGVRPVGRDGTMDKDNTIIRVFEFEAEAIVPDTASLSAVA